tara:strand:+ start:42968 stop:43075 length:108 start_codon:yes stop_codon:yes gene_type:complete
MKKLKETYLKYKMWFNAAFAIILIGIGYRYYKKRK